MSLLSLVCEPLDYFRPSLLFDQHLGGGLDDDHLLARCNPRIRRALLSAPYMRNWQSLASRKDKGSTVSIDKDKFQVSLDVQQFEPEEITVKASGDTITVEGKHEEKQDGHGYISRHFVRKYTLPEGHNIDMVKSKLSSDGVLTISAPKQVSKVLEREIPITLTGQPSEQLTKPSIEVGGEKEENQQKTKQSNLKKIKK